MQARTRSLQLRHQNGDGGPAVLEGYAIRWNDWTEIDSKFEGHFMERFAPGAFDDSIRQNLARIRVLFMHGKDSVVGLRPLGSIEELRDDGTGLFYRVALLDVPYVQDLLPGLRAGLFGASVSFRTSRENFRRNPGPSSYNPEGIPERTITSAALHEFSVVTFAAYAGATAGVRGFMPRWFLRRPIAHGSYLPEKVAVRSQPWRLGSKPWRLGVKR